MNLFESVFTRLKPKEQLPSKEAFASVREKYVKNRSQHYYQLLTKDEDFITFLEWKTDSSFAEVAEQVRELSNYLAHFELGITLVHKKMATKFSSSDIVLSADTIAVDHDAFMYASKDAEVEKRYQGKYLCQLKKAFDLAFSPESLDKVRNHWGVPAIRTEDLFLLIGVEEAAHKQYDQKSNKNAQISEVDSPDEYHITDIEFRALLWKLNIVLRYFPEYVDAFKKFFSEKKKQRAARGGVVGK